MRLLAFAIKDDKLNGFARPFFCPAKGIAVRMFGDLCKDGNTEVGKHPEDYRLFYIGYFDDETASMDNDGKTPELISSGSDWIVADKPRMLKEVRDVN